MKEYIGFDCHKHYTMAEREEAATGRTKQCRIEHRRGAIREYLRGCRAGTPVAVEATRNWYWIVWEIDDVTMFGAFRTRKFPVYERILGRVARPRQPFPYGAKAPTMHE